MAKFNIPIPRMPTAEELAESARKRLALVKDTYLENWPDALKRLSIDQKDILLEAETLRALVGTLVMRMNGSDDLSQYDPTLSHSVIKAKMAHLEARIDHALAAFPEGAFVRLGSRSPKDSWLGMKEGFRVTDGARALAILLDSLERMYEDLSMAQRAGYQPHLFVRRWVALPPWAEFRCFMVDRELVGMSQYDYVDGKRHASIAGNPEGYEQAIRAFFPTFRDACHLDNVTFDVAFDKSEVPLLLEINPCVRIGLTDPCLFRDGNLDGSFRYIGDGRSYDWIRPRPSEDEVSSLIEG